MKEGIGLGGADNYLDIDSQQYRSDKILDTVNFLGSFSEREKRSIYNRITRNFARKFKLGQNKRRVKLEDDSVAEFDVEINRVNDLIDVEVAMRSRYSQYYRGEDVNFKILRLTKLRLSVGQTILDIPDDIDPELQIFLPNKHLVYDGEADYSKKRIIINCNFNTPEGLYTLFHELGHIRINQLSPEQTKDEVRNERLASASGIEMIKSFLLKIGLSTREIKFMIHRSLYMKETWCNNSKTK